MKLRIILCLCILMMCSTVHGERTGNYSYIVEMEKLGVYTGPLDPDDTHEHIKSVYDFIVVGAGSAGSVIASRLSEVPQWSVLLLEAGGPETVISQTRALALTLHGSDKDWKFKSEPQTSFCLSSENAQCRMNAGKSLGGSSAINYLIYSRGSKADFDQWAADGNHGWSYRDVLPYFLKSEDNQSPYLAKPPFHSTGGLLTVHEGQWTIPLTPAFVRAAETLGYENVDNNGQVFTGASIYQCTMRGGQRCSANRAFIRPFRNRTNLQVATYSQVTKILIDDETRRAYGVMFERNKRKYIVHAKKEVIVSAGTLNTPKILMLSGIGPQKDLEDFGIDVIYNSPFVGKNYQNHPGTIISFILNKPFGYVTPRFSKRDAIFKYIKEETGPLTSFGSDALGFFHTKYSKGYHDRPDIEIWTCGCLMIPDEFDSRNNTRGKTYKEDFYDAYLGRLLGRDVLSFIITLTLPESRGFVTLKSKDPSENLLIQPNYFSRETNDMNALVEGIKMAIKLGESRAFKSYGARLFNSKIPGCERFHFGTDAYWECFARHYTRTTSHYTGTCKMGPPSDRTAVVDPELRVYGIHGLRVADASIMPFVPRGHTNAPSIMIGEKTSDMIKRTWRDHM